MGLTGLADGAGGLGGCFADGGAGLLGGSAKNRVIAIIFLLENFVFVLFMHKYTGSNKKLVHQIKFYFFDFQTKKKGNSKK
jgi:hypothetical protein